jgi:hypothetical protein
VEDRWPRPGESGVGNTFETMIMLPSVCVSCSLAAVGRTWRVSAWCSCSHRFCLMQKTRRHRGMSGPVAPRHHLGRLSYVTVPSLSSWRSSAWNVV